MRPCLHCGFSHAAHGRNGVCITGRTRYVERVYPAVRFKDDPSARVFDVVTSRPSALAPHVRMLGLRPREGRWPCIASSTTAKPPVVFFPEDWTEEAVWLEERAS